MKEDGTILDFVPHLLNQLLEPRNLIDIIIVAYIIYRVLLLIRGTRSAHILLGLCLISVTFLLSEMLELLTLNYILQKFFQVLILVIVILFQDEIRRALANIGKNPFFSRGAEKGEQALLLEEVVKAVNILAAKRIGSLIVVARYQGLKNYTEGGSRLNADVTAELIVSIFQPESPIHDGAIVIQNFKIEAAGCFVPVTLEADLDRNLGTRHRAALGMSQETDAVVLVTSEERGEISLVVDGVMTRNININDLRKQLHRAYELNASVDAKSKTLSEASKESVSGSGEETIN